MDPQTVLAARLDRVRFPSRCVECGATPERGYALKVESHQGAPAATLQAPLCEGCAERKSLRQILWGVGAGVLTVGLAVGVGAASELLLPIWPGMRQVIPLVLLVVLGLAAIPLFLALRRGRRAFHRRFSAVWIEQAGPAQGEVTLGFREPTLRREVAVLAGALVAPEADSPFRAAAVAPGPAFKGRKNPVPASVIALVGLGMIPAAFVEYAQLGKDMAAGRVIRRPMLEIMMLKIGGRGAVLALMLLVALGLCTVGVMAWRKATRRS